MANPLEICDYLTKDVVNILSLFKEDNKELLHYKIIGNNTGTSLIIKFRQPCMETRDPVHSTAKHKSPSNVKRDYQRSSERVASWTSNTTQTDTENNTDGLAMSPGNVVHKENSDNQHKQYCTVNEKQGNAKVVKQEFVKDKTSNNASNDRKHLPQDKTSDVEKPITNELVL